ncbi:uncharacterized protein PG986_009481 [Apiospora aurea]|uniref:Uncharacterized protein n=1 Tax=Apiospora aurea TaxID=335848 RepID=A0ABR1Q829_9PEZI
MKFGVVSVVSWALKCLGKRACSLGCDPGESKQERAYQSEPPNLIVAHTGRATLQQIDSIDDKPLSANSQELVLFGKPQLGGNGGADLLTQIQQTPFEAKRAPPLSRPKAAGHTSQPTQHTKS